MTEVGCLAHARRKFFDLHAANKSQLAVFALEQFAKVYDIEREVKERTPINAKPFVSSTPGRSWMRYTSG